MNLICRILLCLSLLWVGAFAPQSSNAQAPTGSEPPSGETVVRGCLRGDRGNYIVVDTNTGMVYVLKGVGTKLDQLRNHQVEATGRVRPGTIKAGIRPEKSGSNPSDTVHGVDGVPFQVKDAKSVRDIASRCKAADQQ
ncbi:MAG TPA: hypothetical protein VFA89_22975 [Terriglobales bacterium]|nr:hypothetical protein [Terriglobales bacterium]